jgi:hypothetical protein
MVSPVDNSYTFTGEEPYTTPDMAGELGTHYMFSQGNYAIPTIQQGQSGQLYYNENANPTDREAIQFDSPEDAEIFARYYKTVAPAFQRIEGVGNDKFQPGGTVKPYITSNPNDPRIKAYEDSLANYRTTEQLKSAIESARGNLSDPRYLKALKDNYRVGYGTSGTTTDEYRGVQMFDFPKPKQEVILKEEYKPNMDTDVAAFMKTVGMNNSYEQRKKMFLERFPDETYSGTAPQNIKLLKTIKAEMQSVQEQPDEVPPQEVYPEKEMDTLPTEDPKTFDIQEWRQEWIKDPNNPAGGYWKKVPAGSTKYLKGFQTGGLLLTKPVRDAIQQAQEQSDRDWISNWYNNRQINDSYIQEGYGMDKEQFLERSATIPKPEMVNYIARSTEGRYQDGVIKVKKGAPQGTYLHEATHHTQDFPSVMRTIHSDIVSNEILPKSKIKDPFVRENYNYYSSPDEVHARIMVLRREFDLKPDEFVTEDKIKGLLKNYQGGSQSLDDLMKLTGGDAARLLNMLNYMAKNNEDKVDIQVARDGGLFQGVEVDPMGLWNGKRPVVVPSNEITMRGVNYDVLGISDEGDKKIMKPGRRYKFKGSKVLEIPLK